jgi:micrococcal nuclease
MVNAELVRLGYAQVLTVPPNVRHAALFRKLAADAREHHRGLWGPE